VSTIVPATIPLLDLKGEVEELYEQLHEATDRVLRSGAFIGGAEVEAFEAEAADFLGVRHAIGLNSGTDALVIALEALDVGPGDEVITSAFSFFATSEAVLRLGATPVFCDVDPVTLNLDSGLLEDLVTERTKALLPVHLFGLPAAMAEVLDVAARHGLAVVEDCAQAFGARSSDLDGRRVGGLGTLGAFSFYPTKNLGAYGDAGMLTTNDDELARAARSLRNHGSSPNDKYLHERLGHNSRLDALQAAILRVKLPMVERWNLARRAVAAEYRDAFTRAGIMGDNAVAALDWAATVEVPPVGSDGVQAPPNRPEGLKTPPNHPDHVYHQFTVTVAPRDRRRYEESLAAAGIGFSRFYPTALTSQPAGFRFGSAPVAEAAAASVLSLPMRPNLTAVDVETVTATLRQVASG